MIATPYRYHLVFDFDNTLFDTHGTKELYPDALSCLRFLSQVEGCVLTLLTASDVRRLQWQKISGAGILPFFSTIQIVQGDECKEMVLKSLRDEVPVYSRRGMVVVGDRLDVEITYGNMLGVKTVHIARGKYASATPSSHIEIPTHSITSLSELDKIIGPS